jgi:hypothetical protein
MHTKPNFRFAFGIAAVAALSACADLDVSNPNAPDLERALATGEDVQNIAVSTVNSWYLTSTELHPYTMMSVTADVSSANFGNFGMRFNNLEPRAEYVNNSAGGDRAVAENPWNFNYGTLGAANDVLKAIAGGVVITNAQNTAKYQALAQFSQAASFSNLALIHDQAFIVDETVDVAANPPTLEPYTAVATAALAKWDKLIADLNGKNETYDATVIPLTAGALTSSMLQKVANTMAARTIALMPRTGAENTAAQWARVLSYAEKGIGGTGPGAAGRFDFTIAADGNNWWSYIASYYDEATWMRVDMRVINMMDPTQPAKYAGTVPPAPNSADARLGKGDAAATDFQFHNAVIGDPARGIYMMSPYSHKRYRYTARTSPVPYEGPVPYILATENDLMIAEALIRTNGSLSRAADLINNTRVGRGNLAPVSAGDGATALLNALYYERVIELLATNGLELFDGRRFEKLQAGTPRHIPVPAKELEVLALPIYTFGGPNNPDKTMLDGMRLRNAQLVEAMTSRRLVGRRVQAER